MNLGEAKEKAIKLIDEYSNKGALITPTKNADYLNRMNQFADMAQRDLMQYKNINAQFDVTQNLIENTLGDQMRLYQYLLTDITYSSIGGLSYYFEVDNLATIYIEEYAVGVWATLATIVNTSVKQFTVYKGNINPTSSGATVRIRFSGSYVYNYRYVAMYPYKFPTDTNVQDYTPYQRYTMPTDYYKLNKIVTEYDIIQYEEIQTFKWEGRTVVVIPFTFKGNIKVLYFKYPTKIEDTTLDTYEFEVDQEVQELIPLYVAQAVLKIENPAISNIIFAEYQNKLSNLGTNENVGQSEMQNIFNF